MDVRERIEALRREIAKIQEAESAYRQTSRRDHLAKDDHARREQRLKEIMAELSTMTAWKKPSNDGFL
jgi:hypothetical protein